MTSPRNGVPARAAEAEGACDCERALEAPDPGAGGRVSRRKLWELAPRHHCMVLGAAFDPRELREMFRRAGAQQWRTASDFDLHTSAAHFAQAKNAFSTQAQRRIEARYRAGVWAFRDAASAAALVELWRSWVGRGQAIEAYWAALTHPACDPDTDEMLWREMHMIGHDLFAQRRAGARRLRAMEERLESAVRERDECRQRQHALAKEATRLREELSAAMRARREALEACERWRSGAETAMRNAQLAEAARALEAARAEADALRRELRRAQRSAERPGTPPQAPLPPTAENAAPPALVDAGPVDLGQSRVLCVGGKKNLVALYRRAVESARGEFLYHDGGDEDQLARLPAMLGRADAVVCLSGDCSHGAVNAVKRYCKRFGKPCALLAQSSVRAVARGIEAMSLPQAA